MNGEIQFWDGSKRRNWFVMRAIARKVHAQPAMLAEAREWLDANWCDNPSKQRGYRLWKQLLALGVNKFESELLADTPVAQETRESVPPYFFLTADEMARALEAARNELALST